jgi:hypothetical protein
VLVTVVKELPSFNAFSSGLFDLRQIDVSRQRLHKIISSLDFLLFFKSVVSDHFKDQFFPSRGHYKKKFNRILVQDSTILKLPKRLYDHYSGAINAQGKTANARLQVCFDLLTNFVELFAIDRYSINDIQARDYISPKKGDLVLRDRGYYIVQQVIKFAQDGVYFIVRHKSNNIYYNEAGGKIDLEKVLSKKNVLSIKIRLKQNEGPLLTLHAQRLDALTVAKRQRSAKLNTKGRKLSKRTSDQLNWAIFITNLEDSEYTSQTIWALYSLRWRIEILFKTLKTHLHLDNIHNVSSNQLQVTIMARFALICFITTNIYSKMVAFLKKRKSKMIISLIKLTANLINNLNQLFKVVLIFTNESSNHRSIEEEKLILKLIKTSCYDKRKRLNFQQMMEITILS